ncbi:DUF2341 domain-containing protein [Thermogladius sp. 4427co]|uniref:DUF2341 domain-containing protein n=1 Tax=Thermogladius sp. 4427co TaxID=3450718 RepID=UPI003F7A8088
MPVPTLTHIIGFSALIAVFIAVSLYAFSTIDYMNKRNMEAVLSAISSSLAGSLRNILISGSNMTLLPLNYPVEAFYQSGYNIYIGNGSVLSQLFPRLRESPGFDPGGIYVIASTPDKSVWGYSLIVRSADLRGTRAYVAWGSWIYNTTRVGFDPSSGYVESGVPWLCRQSLFILEKSGLNLSNYLVKIVFNPSNTTCRYGGLNFTPTPGDIRFTDSDGKTPLGYWIEYWNTTNAVVWVSLPSIPAFSNKTIFMYWGSPTASSRSDPSIFPFFYNFSIVGSQSDLAPTWGILPVNATSWSIGPCNLSGVLGVCVNATFPSGVIPTLLTLFANNPPNTSPVGQGLVVESWGAPLTLNDQDWRLALYNITGGLQWFGIQYIPPVIDPFLNISNYTVIWGNWSVVSTGSESLLNAYNYSFVNKYYAAAIVRWNPPSNAPRGQEEYQILFKVLVYPDQALRGLIIAQNTDLFKNMFIAVNSSGDRIELWAGDATNPSSWTRLDSSSIDIEEPTWFFIYVDILGPGVSNHLTARVYYAGTGETVLSYSKQSGLIPSDPNYVGAFAISPSNISVNSLFDDLISARYDRNTQTVNLTAITFKGLPANWSIELYDGGLFIGNATVDSTGTALIDVSTHPILGVNNPVYIIVYNENGNIVASLSLNQIISGGTILVFLPQLTQPGQQLGAAIHASGVPASGNKPVYTIVFRNSTVSGWVNTNVSAIINQPVIAGLAYFNNSFYYMIYNYTGYYNSSAPSYLYLNSTYYGYMDTTLIVIGVANGYSTGKTVQTAGFYYWVRARPFVYPEPAISFGPVESASLPQTPVVNWSIQPYIVFGSKLLVDAGLVITPYGDYVLIVVNRGVRSS